MFVSQHIPAGKRALAQAKRAYFQKKAKGEMLKGDQEGNENGKDGKEGVALVVSAAQASMGRILSVSDSFVEMSGYLKQEIT